MTPKYNCSKTFFFCATFSEELGFVAVGDTGTSDKTFSSASSVSLLPKTPGPEETLARPTQTGFFPPSQSGLFRAQTGSFPSESGLFPAESDAFPPDISIRLPESAWIADLFRDDLSIPSFKQEMIDHLNDVTDQSGWNADVVDFMNGDYKGNNSPVCSEEDFDILLESNSITMEELIQEKPVSVRVEELESSSYLSGLSRVLIHDL
jgi:hypothetical protein